MIAILTGEDDADALTTALDTDPSRLTSPIAVFEAVLGLCRKRHTSVSEAHDDIQTFLRIADVQIVRIEANDGQTALDAFSRFGKGRGHPAKLNLGDCFAYAMTVSHGAALLFKGDDFHKLTCIAPAGEACRTVIRHDPSERTFRSPGVPSALP